MVAEPEVAGVSPAMIRMVVDLPAPLGPRNPVTRPGRAVKEMSSTAVKPPYFLMRESTLIMRKSLPVPGRAPHRGRTPHRPPGNPGPASGSTLRVLGRLALARAHSGLPKQRDSGESA